MIGVLLDTSAYSAFVREHPRVRQTLAGVEAVFISVVTFGELLAGYHHGTRFERNVQELQEFLDNEGARILPVDKVTAERYGLIHHFLRKAGTPVSPNDLWIAATAMQYGLKVLTTDRDFQKIPQILIELF